MPFSPRSGSYAVVEAVFGILLARALTPSEIEALVSNHEEWKEDLPRLGRTNFVQLGLTGTPNVETIQLPGSGVTFDSIKKDGSLNWRLKAENNAVYVNCLSYTKWAEVSNVALKYLRRVCELVGDDNGISSIILQYVDIFDWEGSTSNYQTDALFSRKSPHLPASIFDNGPLWHLYQGWFNSKSLPEGQRILERFNFDGTMNQNTPTVKIDSFLRLDLPEPADPLGVFDSDSPFIVKVLELLHEQNKKYLRDFLTDEISKKIGLTQ